MEFTSAIVLITEFFIFLPINIYYRRKGKALSEGNLPAMKKTTKILILIANRTFTIVLWLIAPILILLNLYHPYMSWTTFYHICHSFPYLSWLQMIGMVIFSIGLVLLISARLVIKERHAMPWEPSKKAEGFTQTGVYSKIRHPIYSAVFFFLVGYSIWFQSWLAVICFFLSLALIKSAKAEEQWLLKRFGSDYALYMKETGRFFPKLASENSLYNISQSDYID
jgi:protein-S-isoprenylcysteine O-methyltransferase Ste14